MNFPNGKSFFFQFVDKNIFQFHDEIIFLL